VFCGSVLELYGGSLSIHKILIANWGLRVTVGKDWLETVDANVPCRYLCFHVHTPAGRVFF
jgi:hypothetical protein